MHIQNVIFYLTLYLTSYVCRESQKGSFFPFVKFMNPLFKTEKISIYILED
jgi:hypothetical protein